MNSTPVFVPDSVLLRFGLFRDATTLNLLVIFIPFLLGTISSLVSLFVFSMIKSHMPIYVYLRAYCANNFFVCFCGMFQFFIRIYSLNNSFSINGFVCWVSIPTLFLCYLNATMIDLAILMDRISIFNKRAKDFTSKCRPVVWVLILLLYSVAMNMPFYFFLEPGSFTYRSPTGDSVVIWFLALTRFSRTFVGQIVLVVFVAASNGYVMIIQVVLNFLSMYYIRRHLNRKAAISTNSMTRSKQASEVRTSIMVTIMCAVSFMEHIVMVLLNTALVYRRSGMNSTLLEYTLFCLLGLRRFFDFFFFMGFNRVFRRQCFACFGESARVTTTVQSAVNRTN